MRPKHWNKLFAAAIVAVSLLLGACRSTESELAASEPSGPWTTARLVGDLSGHDPLEGFNRSMFEVDCVIMDYIARPDRKSVV